VRIFNYLPDLLPDMTDEDKRRVLSNRLTAILAYIVTQGELVPCMVPVTNAPKGEKPRKATSLQEVLGHQYTSVMDDLLKGYERIEDKSDATQIEGLVERVLQEYELPEDVEAADVKTALLQQVIRIANPKKKVLDRKALEPKGIDAEEIRQKGFDKVWKKISPVESLVCNGTENIDAAAVRQLLSIVNEIPSLKEIDQAIRVFHTRTGKRLKTSGGSATRASRAAPWRPRKSGTRISTRIPGWCARTSRTQAAKWAAPASRRSSRSTEVITR
jgi:hypothetical protein